MGIADILRNGDLYRNTDIRPAYTYASLIRQVCLLDRCVCMCVCVTSVTSSRSYPVHCPPGSLHLSLTSYHHITRLHSHCLSFTVSLQSLMMMMSVRSLLQLETVTSVLVIRSDKQFSFQITTERNVDVRWQLRIQHDTTRQKSLT